MRKMVILRGNSALAGTYPDEKGEKIAWPFGALHAEAAREFARHLCYIPDVLDIPGENQSPTHPQVKEALKRFRGDTDYKAFYGFSGGGYNLKFILDRLASESPETLRRIELVVVLGVETKYQPKSHYDSSKYNAIARHNLIAAKKIHANEWINFRWDLIYKTDPPRKALPEGLPKDIDTHMFGPDVLLAETPAQRCQDWEAGDCDAHDC